MSEIFVSYTSSDRDWAFWIARELEALGHTPRVHEWEIDRGADIYSWMEQRYEAADHVLCVVSDEYLKAPYSTLERNAAQWRAAKERPGFVLFVAVKPCKLPGLSDHIRRCELYGMPEDAARTRFREFMSKRQTPATTAFPGKAFAVSNIPIRLPEPFLGREDALAAIEAAIARYQGRVAITALHGLRGVGKTTLAASYAMRHQGDYRATWWVRAQTRQGLRADLVALGVRLGWVSPDENEEPALAAVMERLTHEGEGILMIYDNAPDAATIRPFLPRGGLAHVLITSNAHTWRGLASPVEIRLWPTTIGADYLIARTGRDDERDAALALSELLGGLPLAHEQAAAYCERLDLSLAEYNRRFAAAPAKFLDDVRHAPAEYHDGLTVAKTFALAIDEAAKLNPGAEPLIVHAAGLAAEPIPLYVFAEARQQLGEPLATDLADEGLDDAVAALRSFALVDRETVADERDPSFTTDCLRLQKLVRQVAIMRRSDAELADSHRRLVDALSVVYPQEQEAFESPAAWRRARVLDPLLSDLLDNDAPLPEGSQAQAADLLNRQAMYRLGALGDQAEAQVIHQRALDIREKALGPDHPDTASSLNNLGLLLQMQGDSMAALPLHERAMEICIEALGPGHPESITSIDHLGRVLRNLGDYEGAQTMLELGLKYRMQLYGDDHFAVTASRNSLALLLQYRGDLAGARQLFEQVLAVDERTGPEDPNTAVTLGNLAGVLQEQDEIKPAIACRERALRIREKSLGLDHPDTNRTRIDLAELFLADGRPDEALALAEIALAADEKRLGKNHEAIMRSARIAAEALARVGRTDEAATLRSRYGIQ